MLSALLFDLDGCIVDSLPSIIRCWTETLPEFGLAVPPVEEIRAHVGPPVNVAARSFAPGRDPAEVAELVSAYRARQKVADDVDPFPGMRELLTDLKAGGMTLGVATSKSQAVTDPLLDRLGLTSLFAVIEGPREDELSADKATVVGRAITNMDPVRPAALVGDREHDVVGAHAHHLLAIGVLWGYGTRAELLGAGVDALVETPAALASYLAA